MSSAVLKLTPEQQAEMDYVNFYAKCEDPKYQLIDGEITMMAPPHRNHTKIVSSLNTIISNHLDRIGRKCDVLPEKGAVIIPNSNGKHYQPDLLVECDVVDEVYSYNPIIIMDVLSQDRSKDFKIKFNVYKTYDSLLEYVVIEQHIKRITVYRKSNDWQSVDYVQGDIVYFESLNLEIDIEEIYKNIDFNDMGVAYVKLSSDNNGSK